VDVQIDAAVFAADLEPWTCRLTPSRTRNQRKMARRALATARSHASVM
jgi:hypothetical protein